LRPLPPIENLPLDTLRSFSQFYMNCIFDRVEEVPPKPQHPFLARTPEIHQQYQKHILQFRDLDLP